MIEDSRGFLWMGTKGGGLCAFDGTEFTTYDKENGLISDQVYSIFEDDKKNLWIGTNNGISHYNGIAFKNDSIINGSSVVVSAIIQDNSGKIWAATHLGLFYQEKDKWINYSKDHNILHTDVSCLFSEKDGSIWTGNDEGLFHINEEKITHYTYNDGLSSNKVRCVARFNGDLLVGTYGRGLNILKNGKWSQVGDPKEIIHHILVDNKKNIWLSTQNNGTVKIEAKTNALTVFNHDKGLSANHVRISVQDSWGNLWFGTSGGGINKYFAQQFKHYNIQEGLKGNKIYSVLGTRNNHVWIGTDAFGLTEFIGDSIIYHDQSTDFFNIKCKALFEDRNGNIWIGTEGKGVYVYNGDTFKNYNGDNGLADNWIRGFTEDSQGNVWVATVSGISKFTSIQNSQYSLVNFRERNGLSDNRITSIVCDTDDRIWFGTHNGQVGYIQQDGRIVNYDQSSGLKKSVVKSLAIDQYNQLWVGTEGQGIFYTSLNKNFITFSQLTKKEGLNANNVYLLKVDQLNQIWVGAGAGIDRISLNNVGEVKTIKHFGSNEGFKGGETCTNSVAISSTGELWVGTLDGLNRHNPVNRSINTQAPKLSITDISLFYESIKETDLKESISDWFNVNEKLNFVHNQNHISIDFKGINHKNPSEVYYQFKLDGFDKNWSPISKKSDATYSNLPSGDYTFRVIAGNEDDVWTKSIEIPIYIKMPFWKTWYFILAMVLLIGGLTYYFMRTRIIAEKKKTEEDRKHLEMERNLLELEQKALRLQMNPHFIFNAMNTVQALIAKKDEKAARYYLAKFSKLMRKVLENSRNQLITIHDEVEALENYLQLEKISSGDQFDFEIIVDENIEPDAYGIPPLLLQPFSENAIVHGLKDMTERGKITVRFDWNEKYIECSVTDNGRGRKAAKEIRHQKSSYHKSTALVLTQERLAAMSSELDVKPFEIIDLENPTGTKVVLRIPIIEMF